jgi:Spy/CpxP family protein refolding chaperone
MTLRITAFAWAAAGLLTLPLAALASPMDGGWHHEGMEFMHGVTLTDTQKQQIHQIAESAHTQMRATEQSLRTVHQQLDTAMLAGETLPQLLPIQRQEDMLREQIDAQRLAVAVQMRNVLTPDQLAQASAEHAKLASLREQEHAVMGEGQ